MSATQPEPPQAPGDERQARLAREAEMIAEAEADIAAGRVIDGEAVSAWLRSLGTDHELPRPQPPKR